MYERILVPLDGSELAQQVLPHVEELARRFTSEVILLRAVTPFTQALIQTSPGDMAMTPTAAALSMDIAREQVDAETGAAQRYLAEIEDRLRAQGITVRSEVVDAAPAAAILEQAKTMGVSLIAMSTHGRGGLGRLVFGSVADEVLQNSQTPVLLIRSSSS